MAPSNSTNSTGSLSGKTALITGGSRGIGAGIALQFAKKGITGLAVTYASSKDAAEAVLAQCRELGVEKTVAVHADLLDPELGPNVIPKVLAGLDTKTLDILVNNAVPTDMTLLQPFKQITLKAFSTSAQGILFGMISLIQSTLPHLPPSGGRIINISSVASKIGNTDPMMVYGALKAGVDSFSRSLAATFGVETGATFNSISVGATETDALKAVIGFAPEVADMNIAMTTAAKRLGLPEDIGFIVGFLASEEGRWINGANVAAHGGNQMVLALQG